MPSRAPDGTSIRSHPCPAGKPASSKKPPAPAWAKPSSGTGDDRAVGRLSREASAFTSARNSSSDDPVASITLARDSVDGQRGLPSTDWRFDLLKAVESRPARLASPEADSA